MAAVITATFGMYVATLRASAISCRDKGAKTSHSSVR
jgi:hypothetical protein